MQPTLRESVREFFRSWDLGQTLVILIIGATFTCVVLHVQQPRRNPNVVIEACGPGDIWPNGRNALSGEPGPACLARSQGTDGEEAAQP